MPELNISVLIGFWIGLDMLELLNTSIKLNLMTSSRGLIVLFHVMYSYDVIVFCKGTCKNIELLQYFFIAFQIYAWLINLLNLADKWIRYFIWPGDINNRKICTVAWNKVSSPASKGV